MEHVIARLLARYENGSVTRRQLIQGLVMVAAAGGTASAADIQGNSINHVSIRVSDLKRSVEFYQKLFGLTVREGGDASPETVRLMVGKSHLSLRRRTPPGTVDHFAVGVNNFTRDSILQELKRRGLTPHEDIDNGLHVKDPDGFNVQFSSSVA